MMVKVESAVIALTERIAELKRDNRRLRDTKTFLTTELEATMTREGYEELCENWRGEAEEMEKDGNKKTEMDTVYLSQEMKSRGWKTELVELTVKCTTTLTAYTTPRFKLAKSAENKRRMESNLRDNRGQQPPFKRQNTSGQNVAKAYKVGNNEKGDMLGHCPTKISAGCTMKGCVLSGVETVRRLDIRLGIVGLLLL
ncbi:hypothetical protein Tco_0088633 [Tanacetum coccineum]